MRRTALALLLASGAVALSGCSISVTANEGPTDEVMASDGTDVAASEEPAPDASEQVEIDQEIYDFCALEATGSLDFIALLGDDADIAITDGIQQSIDQQELTGAQAESCTQAWIQTLADNGVTYTGGPAAGSAEPSPAASPAAS